MLEQRFQKTSCELRQGSDGPMIVGYAAVFDRSSENLGGFTEQVDPTAFSRTLDHGADVRGLGNHDPNWLLGRSKAGTLRLTTDSVGLRYEIDVNTSDPDGQRALAKVQRGDWDGSSFAFQTIQDSWDWSQSPPERRLLEVALVDVGPVTYPAYPDATVASRALSRLAGRMGYEPEELAVALRNGEIRSLIEGGEMKSGTSVKAEVFLDGRSIAEAITSSRQQEGELRAVWSTAYMNDLPDSAFLYVEPGGAKDSDGKTTPRTLRHFPYKDASGKVDLPHLRNALARIPQSDLPADVKDSVTAKAKKILAAQNGSNSLSADLEARVGKMLSSANAQVLRDAIGAIQALLDSSEEMQGGGLAPGGDANALVIAATSRFLAAFASERAMPEMGGDADNLAAMSGAVAAAYLTKRQDLGMDAAQNGFTMQTVADQDGDADGDGQSLWCVCDCDATWWVVANGDQAEVVGWNGNSWGPGWSDDSDMVMPYRMQRELADNRRRALELQQLAAA